MNRVLLFLHSPFLLPFSLFCLLLSPLPSFFLSLSPSPPPRSPILPSSHVPHQPPLPAASPFPGPSTSTTSPTATQWDQGEPGDTEGELLYTSFPRPLAVSGNKHFVNCLSPFSSSLFYLYVYMYIIHAYMCIHDHKVII